MNKDAEAGGNAAGISIWREKLAGLPRYTKRTILVVADFALLSLLVWAAFALRYNGLFFPGWPASLLLMAGPMFIVAVFGWFGIYRQVTRYIGPEGNVRILGCVALAVLLWALMVFMTGQQGVPRSVVLAFGPLAAATAIMTRQFAGWLVAGGRVQAVFRPARTATHTVLIAGAGTAGVQLLKALASDARRRVVGFIDFSPSLWGQYISGIKVYRPERLAGLIERHGVKEVLLALPQVSRHQKRELIGELQLYPVEVKILPSLEDLASGRARATDLRPVNVEDLLGRDPVPPDEALLARSIHGKSVLVTGAGGSVGSELARQILRRSPRRLVLFDVSEAALYQVGAEISTRLARQRDGSGVEVVTVLGSVLDEAAVNRTLRKNGIEVVFHAAAYKHVPIVEENAAVGVHNNVFGTATLAACARAAGTERFVLISTDKAVRPRSVMGASKRLAELILQAHAAEGGPTVFTTVRFGNVLGSSGSVVPIFRQQIERGGPVTVTHPEVVRFFMSIPEAAELVLQAGAMGKGGEVFVLDMGEPVKIDTLARLMIRLSGLEVCSPGAADGDIRIEYIGLRPGEKLYEELFIGTGTVATEHPRISRAEEPALPSEELSRRLAVLEAALKDGGREGVLAALRQAVDGYVPDGLEGTQGAGANQEKEAHDVMPSALPGTGIAAGAQALS